MITTIMFGKSGEGVITYEKNHLFDTEVDYVSAGSFNPTVFTMDNFKFSLINCFKGFYPTSTGDCS